MVKVKFDLLWKSAETASVALMEDAPPTFKNDEINQQLSFSSEINPQERQASAGNSCWSVTVWFLTSGRAPKTATARATAAAAAASRTPSPSPPGRRRTLWTATRWEEHLQPADEAHLLRRYRVSRAAPMRSSRGCVEALSWAADHENENPLQVVFGRLRSTSLLCRRASKFWRRGLLLEVTWRQKLSGGFPAAVVCADRGCSFHACVFAVSWFVV